MVGVRLISDLTKEQLVDRYSTLIVTNAAIIAECEKLREALVYFVPDSPWDIDQICRYCKGYYWHEADCKWVIARAVLNDGGMTNEC